MQYTARLTPISHTGRRGDARGRCSSRAAGHRARSHVMAGSAAGRIAVGVLVTAALLVALLSILSSGDMPDPQRWTSVAVDANGSVWGIAAAHPVSGLSTAETVDLICAQNNLLSATVHPGQTLLIPGVATADTALALR